MCFTSELKLIFFKAPFLVVPGVATKSTRLRFSKDGNYLLVVDVLVRSVLQYRIIS